MVGRGDPGQSLQENQTLLLKEVAAAKARRVGPASCRAKQVAAHKEPQVCCGWVAEGGGGGYA